MFQSYALFPHMTVAQNVAFPLRMAGKSDDEMRRQVREALAQVQLDRMEQRYPHELSGGQKQRVALARGLVNRPRLLLLDEPLGALDAKLREQMQIELIRLQRGVGITFVFVTHAQAEALALSHRIAVMNHGIIEQIDEPDKLYGFPKNRFVADFIGNVNMHEATVEAAGAALTLELGTLGRVAAPARDGVKAGAAGVFVIRPEQVSIRAIAEPSLRPQPVRRRRQRLPLHRRRHHLHRRPAGRQAHRGAAAQLGAGPGEVLRGRRPRAPVLEGRGRRLPGRLTSARATTMHADTSTRMRSGGSRSGSSAGRRSSSCWCSSSSRPLIMVVASVRYPGEFGGLAPLFGAEPGEDGGITFENYARLLRRLDLRADLRQVASASPRSPRSSAWSWPIRWRC